MSASTSAPTSDDRLPGDPAGGPLGRATVALHRGVVLTTATVLASAPALLLLAMVPTGGLAPGLVALAALPVVPAWSALLVAWDAERTAPHPRPWAAFWRAYRRDAVDVLRPAVPAALLLGVVAVTLAHPGAAGVGPLQAAVLAALAGVVVLVAVRAVSLASFFSFRVRDLARLAVHTLLRRPRATLALVAVLVSATGVLWIAHELVLLLLLAPAARIVLHHERAVLDLVRSDFTQEGQEAPQ